MNRADAAYCLAEEAYCSGGGSCKYIAFGNASCVGAYAQDNNSIAIGPSSSAKNHCAIAIGNLAESTGISSIAIGAVAAVYCSGYTEGIDAGIAIGYKANGHSARGGVIIGALADSATEDGSVVIGTQSTNKGYCSVVIGQGAKTEACTGNDGNNTVVIGASASSGFGNSNVLIGAHSNTNDSHNVAIGYEAYAKGSGTTVGSQAKTAYGNYEANSTAIGYCAWAENGSTAVGALATAASIETIAIGCMAETRSKYAVSLGSHTCVGSNGEGGIAIGAFAVVASNSGDGYYGKNSIAIGKSATGCANGEIAIGCSAFTNGENSIAIGNSAQVQANDSDWTCDSAIAIGTRARAFCSSTVVIGKNTCSWGADSVVIGTEASAMVVEDSMGSCYAAMSNVVIGHKATGKKESAIAIGISANAEYCSISLGASATAKCHSISIGDFAGYSNCGASTSTNSIILNSTGSNHSCVASNTFNVFTGGGYEGFYVDGTKITDKFASKSHTHAISDVTNLQTTLDSKAASSHTHTIANVTGLQSALDAKQCTLTAGSNITISGNVISASGGSGEACKYVAIDGTGNSSTVIGQCSIAIGENAIATGDLSIAIGCSAYANDHYTLAFGERASADGPFGISIGAYTKSDQGGVAIGGGNVSKYAGVAVGCNAYSGEYSVNIGLNSGYKNVYQTYPAPSHSVSIGADSNSVGYCAVSLGYNTFAAAGNVAVGAGATAGVSSNPGYSSIAIGTDAYACSKGSITIGDCSNGGPSSVVIGNKIWPSSGASIGNSVVIGAEAKAIGYCNIVIGCTAEACCSNSIAIGTNAMAKTSSIPYASMSIGNGAYAGSGIAIGYMAHAGSNGHYCAPSIVIGNVIDTDTYSLTGGAPNLVALGNYIKAYGNSQNYDGCNVIIGNNSMAFGNNSTAVGNMAAVGYCMDSTGSNRGSYYRSSAFGANSTTSGSYTTSIGANSISIGCASMAIGVGAYARTANSTSLYAGKGPGLQHNNYAVRFTQIAGDTIDTTYYIFQHMHVTGDDYPNLTDNRTGVKISATNFFNMLKQFGGTDYDVDPTNVDVPD